MVTVTRFRPMLEAPDMKGAIAFWTDGLGFEVVDRMEDGAGRVVWCQVKRDDVFVMFSTHYHDDPEEDDHEAALTGSLYFNVDDVDAFAAEAVGRGVEIWFGPEDQPHGMREVGVRDPNGYVAIFGKPI